MQVRDQVAATAIMLCTADAVESLQGSTNPSDYENYYALRRNVVSYGNRLFCHWQESEEGLSARHPWGSGAHYSKYFQDYVRFLERPSRVCKDEELRLSGERLLVIKLDLKQFFDNIHQERIVPELRNAYESGRRKVGESEHCDEEFWRSAAEILRWDWAEGDRAETDGGALGLPQGLVAGGFLANAYLQSFDTKIVQDISSAHAIQGLDSVRLIDYSRYVDDLRMVVAVKNHAEESAEWLDGVASYVNGRLISIYGDDQLQVNEKKSEIVAWEDLALQGMTSQVMSSIKNQVSSAPDPITLKQATGTLDQLLNVADSLDEYNRPSRNELALSRIAAPHADVKSDTIKRFVANSLKSVLRLRKSMADPRRTTLTDELVVKSEAEMVEHEIEATARKLVAVWSHNPSLVSVLRSALDLFPSTDLLDPILDALVPKLKCDDLNIRRVAVYVVAEIYRAAAVETGLRAVPDAEHDKRVIAYRAALRPKAVEWMQDPEHPWYLKQQLALFLAVMGHAVSVPNDPELADYRLLHQLLQSDIPARLRVSECVPAALTLLNMGVDAGEGIELLVRIFERIPSKDLAEAVAIVAALRFDYLRSLVRVMKSRNSGLSKELEGLIPNVQHLSERHSLGSWPKEEELPLLAIIEHPENPFRHEHALLKLGIKLLDSGEFSGGGRPPRLNEIFVSCAKWSDLHTPSGQLITSIRRLPDEGGVHFPSVPEWCIDGMQWAYEVGRILRASAIGNIDFASRHHHLPDAYEGSLPKLRSLPAAVHKRTIGLSPLSGVRQTDPIPTSDWFSHLTMRLLQWPGLELSERGLFFDVRALESPKRLKAALEEHLLKLEEMFAVRSRIPIYPVTAELAEGANLAKLRVGVVQTLLPRVEDITNTDPTYWTAEFRARHRAHLTTMSRLLLTKLRAQSTEGTLGRRSVGLDLIVFPELSVHPDDLWILERISDITGAAIFAGQTFVSHEHFGVPINRAVWLLRRSSGSHGREIHRVYQGKRYPTAGEKALGVQGHRPYQTVVELVEQNGGTGYVTGTICFDATDLDLAADLRPISDILVVAALNKDVPTFDTMVQSLQYHMYQPVILANSGQFGGSTAQAPFMEHHARLISHVHGGGQAAINLFEIDALAFRSVKMQNPSRARKTAPAGFTGRNGG
ncbi:RNA-directed DNA polymerase [Arthrobacter sp. NPDC089319]|uniref:RNA-directed DNA polymerase n=1 Tax=Arthrobacter sp. NPDC089319 TaxID=3155915 RepID=UPI003434A44A